MKFSSILLAVWLTVFVSPVLALQCYKCDPKEVGPTACEDPFDTNLTSITTSNCGNGKNILCVKVVAHARYNKSEKLIGRSCSVEGSQTCNKLRDRLREGGAMLLSCKTCNTDLCNGATGQSPTYVSTCLSVILVIIVSILVVT